MNRAEEIAMRIDPDHTSGINSRTGRMEYRCSCPNAAGHKTTRGKHDKGKSFSISDANNVFGVVWLCYKCDKTELSDLLIDLGYIEIPKGDNSNKKERKTSDAERQMLAKRRKKLESNKAIAEAAKQARASAPTQEDDDGERFLAYTFEFEGPEGEPFIQERRYHYSKNKERKDPIPYHFDGQTWKSGLGGLVPPLQFQTKIIERAAAGKRIYLLEGPKKAMLANKDGLFATCHIGGSKRPWHESYTEILRGAEIYVVVDNDAPGRQWGERVCSTLSAAGIKCKFIDLPGLENEGDDYEQYRERNTVADFLQVCNAAPWYSPPPPAPEDVEISFDTFSNTDKANALRLVRRFGRFFRWTRDGGFMAFTGKKFEPGDEIVGEYAMRNAELISVEAEKARDDDERHRLHEWAKISEGGDKLSVAIRLAKSHKEVRCSIMDFDNQPTLINLANGVLDLDTGRLHKSAPEFMCSKISPVEYNPKAACPVFDEYLKKVTDGNTAKADFLMRAAGYSITGLIGEECLFFLWGKMGRNGKSKLMDALGLCLGDYFGGLPTEALMSQQHKNTANYELAGLVGKRTVSASETEQGQRLAEAFVKRVTGGSKLDCRNLGREFFQYRPQFKLWMDGNYRPTIKGNDPAIKDRLILIPFDVYIPVEQRDKNLVKKFAAERAGIFNRFVRGYQDYASNGLAIPTDVAAAGESYFADLDTIADWIYDQANTGPEFTIPTKGKDLYQSYKKYAKSVLEHDYIMSDRSFYENLERREHIKSIRTREGKCFTGVALKNPLKVVGGLGWD